LRRTLQ